jgi:hypothetical protein
MKFQSDIDIDFGNREDILKHIQHIPAAMRNAKPMRKHATGVHITDIPYDAINNMANIDYKEAEDRGYFKLDLLNVHLYSHVRDEVHLVELMKEPDWSMLLERKVVEQLIHLSNHYHVIRRMPEPVDSIPRLAMLLAIIRPAKKHLIGLPWKEVAKTVWDKNDDGYLFKKSHSIAYANLVVVNMNLISSGHTFDESDTLPL